MRLTANRLFHPIQKMLRKHPSIPNIHNINGLILLIIAVNEFDAFLDMDKPISQFLVFQQRFKRARFRKLAYPIYLCFRCLQAIQSDLNAKSLGTIFQLFVPMFLGFCIPFNQHISLAMRMNVSSPRNEAPLRHWRYLAQPQRYGDEPPRMSLEHHPSHPSFDLRNKSLLSSSQCFSTCKNTHFFHSMDSKITDKPIYFPKNRIFAASFIRTNN